MSLRRLSALRKTVAFRTALLYSAFFIASSTTVLLIAFFILSSSLKVNDHQLIESKLEEYAARYQKSGLDSLKQATAMDAERFLLRVGEPGGKTLFLTVPSDFYEDAVEGHQAKFDLAPLEKESYTGRWRSLPSYDGEDHLEIAETRLPDGNILQLGKSNEEREDVLDRFQNISTAVVIAVIVCGFFVGVFLTSRLLRPVRQIITTTRSIVNTGMLNDRVPERQTQDELQELVSLFNQMLERIAALIGGMKESLDSVAHDLRTPMTRLRATAEMALNNDESNADSREALAECLEESDRVMSMLNTLMDISEAETGVMKLNLEKTDLTSLLEDIVDLYQYVADEKSITISMDLPQILHVMMDRNRIQQAVANLLDNAVKYTPEGGTVSVRAFENQQEAIVMVQDSGIGIPVDEMPRVWDRLYRGDKSRSQRGLGLGLSFVRAIVQAHQGSVQVSSESGKGSIFAIHLPQRR